MSLYSKHTLKNGTTVILVPDKTKKVVTSLVLFGVGSRYELDSQAGISHVLEHMHFKGTKKYPTALQLAEFIEGIGGDNNAFTGKEYTGYFTKVAAKYLGKSLEYLSELLINPLFDEGELEREKNVILQELDMYEDLPQEVASNKFELAVYGNNSLGRDVIGRKSSIVNISRNDIADYRNSHYLGSNCVIVLAGDLSSISEDGLVETIEKQFLFSSGAARPYPEISVSEKKSFELVEKDTEQSHLVVGFKGPNACDPDRFAFRMLALILGGSMSSRMFTEIREKRGLAYSVRTNVASFSDYGSIDTYAGVPHEKVVHVIGAILDEYKRSTVDISDGELSKVKEFLYGKLLIAQEDTNDIANSYANSYLMTGEVMTPEALLKKYQALTKEEIMTVGRKYFKDENLAMSLVGKNVDRTEIARIFKL